MKLQYVNQMPESDIDISFIVPCLNEEKSIADVIDMLVEICAERNLRNEILVFDDASTDTSVLKVKSAQSKYPDHNIILIENTKRRGLARNYVDGAYIGRGQYYMCVMGDNPQPKESICDIVDLMGTADIIIPIFGPNDNRTYFRKLLSKMFTGAVSLCSGYRLGYYNGTGLHRRYNVMRWHSDSDGFAYQAEIIVRLLQEGCSYKEVVIINNDRDEGVSKALNIQNLMSVGHGLFQIFLRRVRYILFYNGEAL